jgi:hypothetical protein
MSCNFYVHNDPVGGTKYISGTTCSGTVAYYYLTIGQQVCMNSDLPMINLNNLQVGDTCFPVTPTPSTTPYEYCYFSARTYYDAEFQCPNDGLVYSDLYGKLTFSAAIEGNSSSSHPDLSFTITNGTDFETVTILDGQLFTEFVYPKINFFYTETGCEQVVLPDWSLYTPEVTFCPLTPTPTRTPTQTPTPTNTSTQTSTPTQTPTNTPTNTTTRTPTPTQTQTQTQTPTDTPAPSCDVSYNILETPTPTATSTTTPTNTPTQTQTQTPTSTPLYVEWLVSVSGITRDDVCSMPLTETYYSYPNAGSTPNIGEYMFYDSTLTQPVDAAWYRRENVGAFNSLVLTDSNGLIISVSNNYTCLPFTPTPTPTITSTPTTTPTNTPTNTQTPSVTPTKNPVCPEQFIVSNSSSALFDNGTYQRMYSSSGQSFNFGYVVSNRVILGTAPNGNNYPIFELFDGSDYNTVYALFVGSTFNSWRSIEQNPSILTSGSTFVGGNTVLSTNSINFGGVLYPPSGQVSGGFITYPAICPTPTPTSTQTSTPTPS